ncbi:hypothetical protein BGZ58_005917 [Dissophora ornata]|nr:hypothetical protein BGZ58_005917 [Dissophora ornata]
MGDLGSVHNQERWHQGVIRKSDWLLETPSRVSPGQVSKVKLKNLAPVPVGYKFKTNAPMKYSVKPVLGVLGPGESIKIFVRSDSWISPQDRFLLQTIGLTEEEGQALDPRSWKTLDSKRFNESYIPCTATSALSLRDPEDDAGSWSSSSATSSAASSPPFHAYDMSRSGIGGGASPGQQGGAARKQVFERWQYAESTRPTISIGGLGRRLSSGSSTCSSATSSPGSYPTLFTSRSFDQYQNQQQYQAPSSPVLTTAYSSKRSSISSNFHSSIITSTIKEESSIANTNANTTVGSRFEPTQYLLTVLGFSEEQVLRTMVKFKILQQYSKRQVLLLSLMVCLLLGMLMPVERVLEMVNGGRGASHSDGWISYGDSDSCSTGVEEMEDAGPGAAIMNHGVRSDAYFVANVMADLNDLRLHQDRQFEILEGAV